MSGLLNTIALTAPLTILSVEGAQGDLVVAIRILLNYGSNCSGYDRRYDGRGPQSHLPAPSPKGLSVALGGHCLASRL